MKVIFLDIDGVLNSDKYFDKIEGRDIHGIEEDIDVETIKLLRKAVEETGAKVVLSSSWRYIKRAEHLKQLLFDYGVLVHSSTPYLKNERGEEIKKWLKEHPDTEDFVLLDDEVWDSYDEELLKKLVKMSDTNGKKQFGDGLQEKDIEEIINRFGRIKRKDEDDFER